MVHIDTTRIAVRNLGRRVRALRIAVGMSQIELGRRSRVTPKFIGQIERATSNSSVASLALIAEALGCHLSDFFPPDIDRTGGYRMFHVDEIRRAREASATIQSILSQRGKPSLNKPSRSTRFP